MAYVLELTQDKSGSAFGEVSSSGTGVLSLEEPVLVDPADDALEACPR